MVSKNTKTHPFSKLLMPNYLRNYEGNGYFFTVVTFNRLPLFTSDRVVDLLQDSWEIVSERFPFTTLAYCILPNHIHTIWTLPENDQNYSVRWKGIKSQFTKRYLSEIGPGESRSLSRRKRGEAAIWQRRFWEHAINNGEDLGRHIDYIHFNPVKHGLVSEPSEWKWSSFSQFVDEGFYGPEWKQTVTDWGKGDFGE